MAPNALQSQFCYFSRNSITKKNVSSDFHPFWSTLSFRIKKCGKRCQEGKNSQKLQFCHNPYPKRVGYTEWRPICMSGTPFYKPLKFRIFQLKCGKKGSRCPPTPILIFFPQGQWQSLYLYQFSPKSATKIEKAIFKNPGKRSR